MSLHEAIQATRAARKRRANREFLDRVFGGPPVIGTALPQGTVTDFSILRQTSNTWPQDWKSVGTISRADILKAIDLTEGK